MPALFAPIIVIALVVAAIVFVSVKKHRQQVMQAWAHAARELGLTYVSGSLFKSGAIRGKVDGYRVLVDTYTQSSGNSSQTFTRYRVRYPPLGMGLKLRKERLFSRVAKFFGTQDIEVGDAAFDAAILVQGNPRRVKAFLTPLRRRVVQRLIASYKGCVIEDTQIAWSRSGLVGSSAMLVSTVRRFVDVARQLREDPEHNAPVEQALSERSAGKIDTALEILQPIAERDQSLEVKSIEGELLYTAGRYEEAAEVFEKLGEAVPEDPDVRGWGDHAAQRSRANPKPEPEVVPSPEREVQRAEPEPVPAEEPSLSLAVDDVCAALFGPGKLSYEANALFESDYEGRAVEWSGELTRVDSYSYDFIFGNGPAVKAFVRIWKIDSGVYGGDDVSAVVSIDAKADELRPRLGEQVTFRGRLVRCDSLMRNVFVAEAALLS